MYIVAIAWLYVVFLMALTASTLVSGLVTFFLFGVLPTGMLIIVTGSSKRSRRLRREAIQRAATDQESEQPAPRQ